MRRLLNPIFFPAILIIFTFLLYAPSLPGEFYFDDGFLLESDVITNLKNLSVFFQGGHTLSPMRGVSLTTFALQYQFFGWNPGAFRGFNIVLHFLNGLLIWRITRHLVKRLIQLDGSLDSQVVRTEYGDESLPALVALGFLAHPVFTSGVSYIFQRNGLLSTLFYLMAFYSLLRAFPISQRVRAKWIVSSCGWYLLSIWSKEIGITFIIIVVLFEWIFQPDKGRKDRIRWYYPVAGICLFSFVMVFWQMIHTPILKRTMYGNWNVWQNVITQWNVIVEYLTLIFWPHPNRLNIDRDFPVVLSFFEQGAWLSGLILLAIVGFAFQVRQREPLLAFGILWFFVALIPESTVIPISEVMVEYRLYLPGFGFVLALIRVMKIVSEKLESRQVFSAGGALILILFSVFTWQRNGVMKEAFFVWKDAAEKSPYNIRAQTAYATYLKNQGHFWEALAIYKRAVVLNKMNFPYKLPMVQPHNELGVYFTERDEWERARDQFVEALRINPWFSPARENLKALMERTDETTYEKNYLSVFDQIDVFPQGHYNLGNFYMRSQQYKKAVGQFEIAILQKRNFYEAYNNLGIVCVQIGKPGKAWLLFEKALEISPGFKTARDNLTALSVSETGSAVN